MMNKRFSVSFGRCPLLSLFAVVLVMGASASLFAQDLPHTGFCNGCSSSAAFADAAEEAAPDAAPGDGTPVIYPVYVINPANGSIHYFDVHVWYDWGDGQPHSSDSGDHDDRNEGLHSIGLQKAAYPGNGDPEIFAAMQEAHSVAVDFASSLQSVTVYSGDIGYDGDSAIDLVGPQESPANYNRKALQNALTDHYGNLAGSLIFGLPDMVGRLANRFIGPSGGYINPYSRVHVEFPDGTTIQLEITNVSTGFTPGDVTIEFEVKTHTARLPDGSPVPESAGEFDGFSYSGDTSVIQLLADLADRFGISITGTSGSTMVCVRIHGGPVECELVYH